MPISPTAEGFRVAFRQPSLALGEITWRWTVGATAVVLFFFGLFEYLSTLPVTNGELLFLRTRQPYLVGQAILHILRGSLNRGVLSALLAVLLLVFLWVVAASLGRIATVGALLEHVREQLACKAAVLGLDAGGIAVNASAESPFQTLIRLNLLRASLALAVIVGLAGAAILASFASPGDHPSPGVTLLLLLPMAALIFLLWSGLNWLLSLATMFAVRDREDTLGAISAAVSLCRERSAAVFAVSTWAGVAHLVLFVGATSVVSLPLGLAGVLPWRLVVLGVVLITLAYFGFTDWLYTARLAGYVCIAEMPDALLHSPQEVSPNLGRPVSIAPPLQTTIDRDEPILSDIPGPEPET